MGLPDRKSNTAQSAGETTNENANSLDSNPASSSLLGRIRSSISRSSPDNPDGLGKSAPQRSTVFAVIVGMILGLVTAYAVFPTEFTGAAPRHMSRSAIEQWVRMIAVGHSQTLHYDEANAIVALQQVPDPKSVVTRLEQSTRIAAGERDAIAALKDINGYDGLVGALAPADPGLVSSSLQILLAVAVVAIGTPALLIVMRQIVPGRSAATAGERRAMRSAAATGAQAAPPARVTPRAAPAASPESQWPEEETEKSGVVHSQYGVPVLHTVSTYAKGGNYDESFAIELGPDQGNQFLGECGISTATRVGNELQSVEFWGFDMASQETLTKVFAAPAAISEPGLIAAVGNRVKDPTSDIIAVTLGARLIVDTYAIQIRAEIKSVVCNYGGGSPNSGIESLQIEILAWQKQGHRMGAPTSEVPPATENPFVDYSNMEYASSGQMPSPPPPPPVGGQYKSARPGPDQAGQGTRPEDDEDDPFGGTGNFMPYS